VSLKSDKIYFSPMTPFLAILANLAISTGSGFAPIVTCSVLFIYRMTLVSLKSDKVYFSPMSPFLAILANLATSSGFASIVAIVPFYFI
jgi:hypothetical protein